MTRKHIIWTLKKANSNYLILKLLLYDDDVGHYRLHFGVTSLVGFRFRQTGYWFTNMASSEKRVFNRRKQQKWKIHTGVYCIASGCKNGFYKSSEVHFHRLPLKDPKLLKAWLAKMKRAGPPCNESARICSDHFRKEDYKHKMLMDERSGRMVKHQTSNLIYGAIPSIFYFSSYELNNEVGNTDHPSDYTKKQVETKRHSQAEQMATTTAKMQQVNTNDRICKRLSKVHVTDSEGNSELAETKELMLNTLSKSNLKESTLIEFLTWMRSLIVVRGGRCVRTEGLYYLAEVEDQTPNAKKALDEVVIQKDKVRRKTRKISLDDSHKINVSFHLQHKQMKPTCKSTVKSRKVIRTMNSSLNSTDVELREVKRSCETNCTQMIGVNPIPVSLVRVDHSSPNTRLFVFNNSDGTSRGVPNMSSLPNISGGVPNMNIDMDDQVSNSTENKAAKHDSETEMNQISVPYIKQEPIEASDMKDQISNSTENKANRCDMETEMSQISGPYIKQEPIESVFCSDNEHLEIEVTHEMDQSLLPSIDFQIEEETCATTLYQNVPLCNFKNESS